ncbi:virulence RhuM family protein [Dethiosulfatarculus sandiegensis]|uniref:2-hydroxyacid dehydrogenase n=1 Tax=Dethiosulfatarculus sandiegensis TaxID=1429043 RepID=A0A0D2G9X6_9BACT|nr:virulence RhuM family protein [Dethiosulfatarculus sandiegensis]KIX11662.1 2-hydroxyacid dehydrogenase [Dethiosulfatarculus sandiegensis]
MGKKENNASGGGEIIVYPAEDGRIKLDVRLQDENVWLTQQLMAELFQTTQQNISLHIHSVYDEGELAREATHKKYLSVRQEGNRQVRRNLDYYNLDMIISVGYRVKSPIATRFRIWATQRLKEYIIKGFVMDDERLKNPPVEGSVVPDYFDEMLERIRDIRASERRMYLRVREIFAMAGDYDPSSSETRKFFSIIQNKLHYAATGMTAAELIKSRADHLLPNMGLTNWKNDEVRKGDVTTAKNYLSSEEIDELNRIVVMWLDFADDQARRRKQVFMKDWEQKLDEFLRFNDREVLPNAGKMSKKQADEYAKAEYDEFEIRRREYKEVRAEEDYVKELEEAVKSLPPGKKGGE